MRCPVMCSSARQLATQAPAKEQRARRPEILLRPAGAMGAALTEVPRRPGRRTCSRRPFTRALAATSAPLPAASTFRLIAAPRGPHALIHQSRAIVCTEQISPANRSALTNLSIRPLESGQSDARPSAARKQPLPKVAPGAPASTPAPGGAAAARHAPARPRPAGAPRTPGPHGAASPLVAELLAVQPARRTGVGAGAVAELLRRLAAAPVRAPVPPARPARPRQLHRVLERKRLHRVSSSPARRPLECRPEPRDHLAGARSAEHAPSICIRQLSQMDRFRHDRPIRQLSRLRLTWQRKQTTNSCWRAPTLVAHFGPVWFPIERK